MDDLDPSPRSDLSRRGFVRAAGGAAILPAIRGDRPRGETAVARLFGSLSDAQKARLVFPSDHPLRRVALDDWKVTETAIGDLTADQRATCREILRGICSAEGLDRVDRVMNDDGGGFASYHVALFGEPEGDRPFEWLMTGPHLTIRADGRRDGVASSGGPWFFGHSASSRNAWSDPARRVNAIFAAIDEDQKARGTRDEGGTGGESAPVAPG